MSQPTDLKKLARQKKIEELRNLAFTRKINNQYEFLKQWDKGKITGMECIEAIVNEEKVFRIENDLSTLKKAADAALPKGP